MRVIVAGGRKFNNYGFLKEKLNNILKDRNDIEIVCGLASGVDKMGERYALHYEIPVKYFPANWGDYGKSAGYLRNKQMAEYSDALIAFWDGQSKGTKHMIDLAKEYNLKVRVIRY